MRDSAACSSFTTARPRSRMGRVFAHHALGNLSVSFFTGYDWVVDTDQQQAAIVLERIRQVEGPVYSTDMVLLYRAGKSVAAEPFMISVLAESGRVMARTGLRMMPTSPSPPLKFRTAGLPQYRLQG